jgi:hypothetical protein
MCGTFLMQKSVLLEW